MKIKFNLDDKLPINKIIEIPTITIVVTAIFLENSKYYPQVFLDEYLYKTQNIESKDKIKEIDIKTRTCYYFDDIIKDVDI